jgi:hypothetical protein
MNLPCIVPLKFPYNPSYGSKKVSLVVQKKNTLKCPWWFKKILLCPPVPYVVQIKAPSSVLPHEGGRRDVGSSMGIIADLLLCP